METWTLTTPVSKTVTTYQVAMLQLNWLQAAVYVELRPDSGDRITHVYTGEAAINLMTTLNRANFSTKSLHKRILEQLAADGVINPGTATGVPD